MKSKKNFSLLALTSLVLALSLSCSSMESSINPQGPSLRAEDVARLKPGMSAEEVINILGFKPQARLTQPDGNTEMTWSYYTGAMSSYAQDTKTFSVLFGPDGKMIRIIQKSAF